MSADQTQGAPRVIAVGSTNLAKVAAVRRIVARTWPQSEVIAIAVPSGVGEMPATDAQGQAGARERAHAALQATGADLAVGLEGAVQDGPQGMVVCNWAVIISQDGRESVAQGGRLPLPERIAQEIRQGGELGPIMDRYTGQAESKQHQGAAGFLTRGLVPREQAFELAVAFALAPFLRPELYAPLKGNVHDAPGDAV
jgi:inosine/xanthosine triphosphatase